MPIVIRDHTNTPRTVTAIQVRDATNTPRTISEVWVRDSNNVPRRVFSLFTPLSVTLSHPTVSGVTFGSGVATTNSTTALPSGGVAPYSYVWTLITYSNGVPPTALSPNSATTSFRQTNIASDSSDSAEFRVTVTDDQGNTAQANCLCAFVNTGTS